MIRLRQRTSLPAASRRRDELAELRAKLAYNEESLRAIRTGEVDTLAVAGSTGLRVFTLEGAEQDYRALIETMNEGALTLSSDMVILFANQSFATMVGRPLEEVMGGSFRQFLSAADWAGLQPSLRVSTTKGVASRLFLKKRDGSRLPVLISVGPLREKADAMATISVVVTDMTAARRSEEQLRALTRRVVQVQEAERERIVRELHDHVTQHICAIVMRLQAHVQRLSSRPGAAEAAVIRDMLGQAVNETERISFELRPSVLKELGLVDVMRDTGDKFAKRTGITFSLCCAKLGARLPTDIELALYRILQESLGNIETHAGSRQVSVFLRVQKKSVHLRIVDDGVGFDVDQPPSQRFSRGGLGLLSMRERASYVGGVLTIESVHGSGTEIDVRIPLPDVWDRSRSRR